MSAPVFDPPRDHRDRVERRRRASRDAKRIERADRHSALRDQEPTFRLGSTVRALA